jgi:hypothetical protein
MPWAFGLLNLTTMHWHADVIAQLGLHRYTWADLAPLGEIMGNFILNGKPILRYAPIGDYQCALAGAMLEEDDLSLNISTGSQITRVSKRWSEGSFQQHRGPAASRAW